MSESVTSAARARPAGDRQRRPRTVGGSRLGQEASREARRLAAALLEVLAGLRTPTDAAAALGVSLPRYYQLESRALAGLLRACERPPHGRQPGPGRELAALRQANQKLQRDLQRQQALVRLAQRSLGLTPPATPPATKGQGKKARKRRPQARALHVAARLQADAEPLPPTPASLQQAQS